MENTEKKVEAPKYKFWKDSKMMGTILLIVSIIFLIFAFVKVPFVSTINGYTVGMLLGFYSPFFYGFVIYISLVMIFGEKIKPPKWFKLNAVTYWIVALSIIFIASSTGFYQSKVGFTAFGGKPWKAFDYWFDAFTDNKNVSAWTPRNTNGGVVGAMFYSLTATALSGIGTLILAILILTIAISFLATGSAIGLHKDIITRKKVELTQKEIKNENDSNIENLKVDEPKETKQPKEEKKEETSFPFDDPF